MKRLTLAVALLTAAALPARAQVPAGGELVVNTYLTGTQWYAGIAVEPDGDFVVVWSDFAYHDGDGTGFFGQRFDRAGAARGVEFQVNSFTTGYQGYYGEASVATRKNGDFVVNWQSYGQVDRWDVFAQRWDAAGAPSGAEFLVNTYTFSDQGGIYGYGNGSVSMAPNGTFVVVWSSYDDDNYSYLNVKGQRYAADGTPLGGEFVVNANSAYSIEGNPDVGMDGQGNFVVVWSGNDGSGYGVFGRRFGSTGDPIGGDFQVNTYTTGLQSFLFILEPSVARAAEGNFVVAWDGRGPDGAYDVFARRFTAGGTPLGDQFQVNSYTTGPQVFADVGSDALGNFTVVWTNIEPVDGSQGSIWARRYTAAGVSRGPEFRVNTYTTGFQQLSGVGMDTVGNFVVSWDGYGGPQPNDVIVQRFGGLFTTALRVDTTRNGVIEPGETADVRPSWRNHNGADQTVGGQLSNLVGPGGPLYTITDGTADYGTVADATTAECTDCYEVSVATPGTRPSTHWDASADELITPDAHGQNKRWLLHVGNSFGDVSTGSIFYRFIETLLHNSVTSGCAPGAYCPSANTTRQEMAVFVLAAKEGGGFVPPACTVSPFPDVPAGSPFCRFIQELANRGVVSGCGGGNYCPADPVTRQEMAVFALATLDPTFVPPPCTVPPFNDVPIGSVFCRFIQELANRGVVAGCGGGNYCPGDPVLRQEMSVFLSGTFGLALYGP